ncbi:MAG: Gfo/Idh/MocA family oxidoreductase [Deinococcus sp.]|nr:Gfo/Idh/MocA family oxidoreductase [Deinococcus sp.]
MALTVGILGAGYMGRTHSQILQRDKQVSITAVADPVAVAAKTLAEQCGAKALSGLDELLDSGVQAVFITSPNATHVEASIKALGAGCSVFCEKPMAVTLQSAQEVVAAAKKAKGVFQVGHNRRFAPVYTRLKELIASGEFKPLSAHIKMNRGELKKPSWVWDPKVTGGFLYESTLHLFDMARWLLGDVERLIALSNQNVYPTADDFSIVMEFKNGVTCAFTSSAHTTWIYPFESIELYAEHQALVTEEMERVRYSPGLERGVVEHNFFQLAIPEKWGYAEEDRLFINAALGEGEPPVTALDGYKSVEIADAVYRSKGRWMSLGDTKRRSRRKAK